MIAEALAGEEVVQLEYGSLGFYGWRDMRPDLKEGSGTSTATAMLSASSCR
jgi:hypothetical protein